MMSSAAIEIEGLVFAYGRQRVLEGVDLNVKAGSIFGFLGRNGAGKTTTIKVLLGLLRPTAGRCSVQGVDPAAKPLVVRRNVGYMAEDQQMYGWMRVSEIIKWVAAFYPAWDKQLTSGLQDVLKISSRAKVKTLSKGQNSSLALLLALGHRPSVVILDDPTLGLDPIARKDFLRHVIDLLQTNGVTVFFSSHLLYEIEPVADHVAILDGGRIVKTSPTERLRETVRRFTLRVRNEEAMRKLPGLLDATVTGEHWSVAVEECDETRRRLLRELSVNGVQEAGLNLDEIFEAYIIGNRGRVGEAVAGAALAQEVGGDD